MQQNKNEQGGQKMNKNAVLTKDEESQFIKLLETKATSPTEGFINYIKQPYVRFIFSQIQKARGMQPANPATPIDAELRNRCEHLSQQLLQREQQMETMACKNNQLQSKLHELEQDTPKHAAAWVCVSQELNEAKTIIIELQKKAKEEAARSHLADMQAKKIMEELKAKIDDQDRQLAALQQEQAQTRMQHEVRLAAQNQEFEAKRKESMAQETAREESSQLQWNAKLDALREQCASDVAIWKSQCEALIEAQTAKDLLCPQVQDKKRIGLYDICDENVVSFPIAGISDFVFLPNRAAHELTLSEIADELGEERFGSCVTAHSDMALADKIRHIFCVVSRTKLYKDNENPFVILSLSELLHSNRLTYTPFLISSLTHTGLGPTTAQTISVEIDAVLFPSKLQNKKRK